MVKKLRKNGFTIVELVIVIAVIAILAAVLIPTFTNVIEKANKSSAMQAARNEYELYLAEYAKDLDGTEDLYIVTEKYMFAVVDGQFSEEALAIDNTKYEATADMSKEYVKANIAKDTDTGDAYTYAKGAFTKVTFSVSNKAQENVTYYQLKLVESKQVDLGNANVAIYKAD